MTSINSKTESIRGHKKRKQAQAYSIIDNFSNNLQKTRDYKKCIVIPFDIEGHSLYLFDTLDEFNKWDRIEQSILLVSREDSIKQQPYFTHLNQTDNYIQSALEALDLSALLVIPYQYIYYVYSSLLEITKDILDAEKPNWTSKELVGLYNMLEFLKTYIAIEALQNLDIEHTRVLGKLSPIIHTIPLQLSDYLMYNRNSHQDIYPTTNQ